MGGVDIEIDATELLEALNDPAKQAALLAERGWTADDLLARAEELNRSLVESMSSVNIV